MATLAIGPDRENAGRIAAVPPARRLPHWLPVRPQVPL